MDGERDLMRREFGYLVAVCDTLEYIKRTYKKFKLNELMYAWARYQLFGGFELEELLLAGAKCRDPDIGVRFDRLMRNEHFTKVIGEPPFSVRPPPS